MEVNQHLISEIPLATVYNDIGIPVSNAFNSLTPYILISVGIVFVFLFFSQLRSLSDIFNDMKGKDAHEKEHDFVKEIRAKNKILEQQIQNEKGIEFEEKYGENVVSQKQLNNLLSGE